MTRTQTARPHNELQIWNDALTLAEVCYRLTCSLPQEEQYELSGQIRRAASAIPVHIAEAYGMERIRAHLHSLRIAQRSLKELESHLLLAKRLGYVPPLDPCLEQCERLEQMLGALAPTLDRKGKTD